MKHIQARFSYDNNSELFAIGYSNEGPADLNERIISVLNDLYHFQDQIGNINNGYLVYGKPDPSGETDDEFVKIDLTATGLGKLQKQIDPGYVREIELILQPFAFLPYDTSFIEIIKYDYAEPYVMGKFFLLGENREKQNNLAKFKVVPDEFLASDTPPMCINIFTDSLTKFRILIYSRYDIWHKHSFETGLEHRDHSYQYYKEKFIEFSNRTEGDFTEEA